MLDEEVYTISWSVIWEFVKSSISDVLDVFQRSLFTYIREVLVIAMAYSIGTAPNAPSNRGKTS